MTTINEIFQAYAPQYLRRYGHSMPKNHHKVIETIVNCRTPIYGITVYQCEACGEIHTVYRSCGSRHCPTCQNHKTRQWLEKQLQQQLPGHHFLITFTVPETLRSFIRSNQRLCYNALFKASSDALKVLAADEKYIGGDLPGFFGVLHTWGRTLQYHPHIHYVVPGGALSKQNARWHPSRTDFYVPNRALSKIFRAKFCDEINKAQRLIHIPPEVWKVAWNVDIRPIGASEHSLKYLAPYVFKVAITNSRIVKVEKDTVTIRYKKGKSPRWRSTALDVMEFIRRFLQHVLPTGFMKIRYYGFMNSNSSIALKQIASLIELAYGFTVKAPVSNMEPVKPLYCQCCGGKLQYRYSILPFQLCPSPDTG